MSPVLILTAGGKAWVVQKVDIAIHLINHYPVDSVVCFVNTYRLDSNLSGGNWSQLNCRVEYRRAINKVN